MIEANENEVREAAIMEEIAPLVVEEVKAAPKRKPAAKPAAPSDKTVIQNLKKEVAALKATIQELEEERDTANGKCDIYFKKLREVNEELTAYRKQVSDSVGIMFDSVNATLRSFSMLINK